MRVLYITNIPSPYRVAFFEELGKKAKLTVIFGRKSARSRNEDWKQESFQNFEYLFLKGINIGDDNSINFGIRKYLCRDFDVIIVGGYSLFFEMYAIKYMKQNHIDYWISCDGALIKNERNAINKIKKYFIGGAKGYFSTSKETDSYLKHYGVDKCRIWRYPFTSLQEEDIFDEPASDKEKKELREQLSLSNKRIVLTVGRFIKVKGVDLLIRAAKLLEGKNIDIYVVGGIINDEYKQLIEELHIENVFFVDYKPKKIIWKYFRAADVFVLATRGDMWGLVINEAMACGLPIITTDRCIAGNTLVENEINGYICKNEDYIEISKKIELLINEEALFQIGQNNIDKIKDYTIKKMATRYMDILMEERNYE